jgi:hypothetical protein
MRCYICDFVTTGDDELSKALVTIDREGKPVCSKCVKESRKYWNYRGKEGVHDISANVEHQVAELEKRMPALMSGPSCPMDIPFGCKCTYKTGCKFYVDNPRLKR